MLSMEAARDGPEFRNTVNVLRHLVETMHLLMRL